MDVPSYLELCQLKTLEQHFMVDCIALKSIAQCRHVIVESIALQFIAHCRQIIIDCIALKLLLSFIAQCTYIALHLFISEL